MIELTYEQKQIVESPEKKIVVMSAAASGKTVCLIERVRWILKQGGEPTKMVCITFTNNSADEMKARLADDYKEGMFIGTVHSYANYLLNSYGVDTKSIRDSEDFDELFELIMENPGAIKPIGFLALDEAQDSNNNQFEFIFDMLQPKAFIVLGDVRQSIYGFNNANPKLILRLCREDDITVYDMTENHRNGKEIIKYSNWILDKMKDIPKTPVVGTRNEKGYIGKVGESQFIKLIEKSDENYGSWTILCRTNKRIQQILGKLKSAGIPAITFRQAQGDVSELKEKMRENSVKVLTIHSAKGLEWDNVIVADQSWRGEENLRLMYVAATRARNKLYWVQGY